MDSNLKIMIHACPSREWYVNQFLIPSLEKQNIKQEEIKVWHDYHQIGNLQSFISSCQWIAKHCDLEKSLWHLQDDVIISKNFKQEIDKEREGVCAGFVCKQFNGGLIDKIGQVPSRDLWYSFPCIKIPNRYLEEFYNWIYTDAIFDNQFFQYFKQGKCDDTLFMSFMKLFHTRERVWNLCPNIVDHIDWAIGGSITNKDKRKDQRRAFYWQQENRVRNLVNKLERTKQNNGERLL